MTQSSRPNLSKQHSLLQQPSLDLVTSADDRTVKASPSKSGGRGVAVGLIVGLILLQVITLGAALSIVRAGAPQPNLVLDEPSLATEPPAAVAGQSTNPTPLAEFPAIPTSLPTEAIPPTPIPSPTPTSLPVPVKIRAVELTQGIQVLQEPENPRCQPDPAQPLNVLCNNSMPMVAGRHTMLRVYLACNPNCPAADTSVRLRLLKDGQEQDHLMHDFAAPALQRVDSLDLAQLRDDLDNSVNFAFLPPPAWMSGQITFELEVTPYGETTLPPDRYSLTKEFVERKPLRVAYLPIDYEGHRPSDPAGIEHWLLRLYPVPGVEYFRLPMPDMTWEGEISKSEILRKLLYTYWLYGQYRSNEAHPDQLFGWLPMEAYNGGAADPFWCPNCAGPHSSRVAFGGLRPEQDIGGARILAHEIAHNLGAQHAWSPTATEDAGCFKSDGTDIQVDPGWPYDFTPNIQEFGIDLYSDPPIIYPPDTYDMMSYCTRPWISPFTYRKIFDSPFLQPDGVTPPIPTEYLTQVETTNAGTLMISGVVYPNGTVSSPEILRLEGEAVTDPAGFMPPQATEGDYCLDVWDRTDRRLGQRCFNAGFSDLESHAPADSSAYLFILPEIDPADVAKITVSRAKETLVEVTPSRHKPELTLTSPESRSVLSGRQTITWQAKDSDGDRLSYDILYSLDDGRTWLPLAVQLSNTSYTFHTSQLPAGGAARLRVSASDGFHTTTAESPAIFVD
ncbi:MAG TPA: hypothetical protein P5526_09640 [Anaerolineae bacterium]|nr:hypothetical protein [Anaerolineae bacterium]